MGLELNSKSSVSGVVRAFILLIPIFLLTTHDSRLTAAWAAEPIPRIAVIDVEKILENYRGTASSDKRLEELSKTKQGEREKIVSEIKGMREELILLNEGARAERQRQIEEKLKGLASFDRETRQTLGKKREEELKTIFDEVEAMVSAYAKEKGYTLVVTERAVLFHQEGMDLTDQIIKILNDRYDKRRS